MALRYKSIEINLNLLIGSITIIKTKTIPEAQ